GAHQREGGNSGTHDRFLLKTEDYGPTPYGQSIVSFGNRKRKLEKLAFPCLAPATRLAIACRSRCEQIPTRPHFSLVLSTSTNRCNATRKPRNRRFWLKSCKGL